MHLKLIKLKLKIL